MATPNRLQVLQEEAAGRVKLIQDQGSEHAPLPGGTPLGELLHRAQRSKRQGNKEEEMSYAIENPFEVPRSLENDPRERGRPADSAAHQDQDQEQDQDQDVIQQSRDPKRQASSNLES